MTSFDESKHNRSGDGKFVHKPHSEATSVSLQATPTRLPEDVVERFQNATQTKEDETLAFNTFTEALPNNIELIDVGPHGLLDDNQTDRLLAGDWDNLYNELSEQWMDNAAYEQMRHQLEETAQTIGFDYEEYGDTLEVSMESAIYEQDTSNPIRDLTRNRGKDTMRFELAVGGADDESSDPLEQVAARPLAEGGDDEVAAARAHITEKRLTASGVIAQPLSAADRAALTEAFKRGPQEWEDTTVGTLFNASALDVALPADAAMNGRDETLVSLTNEGRTRIVLVDDGPDPVEGAVATINTPTTLRLSRNSHVELDEHADYSRPVWGNTLPSGVDTRGWDATFKGD